MFVNVHVFLLPLPLVTEANLGIKEAQHSTMRSAPPDHMTHLNSGTVSN